MQEKDQSNGEKNEQISKENRVLKFRLRTQERHRMRWSICIKGIKERKEERHQSTGYPNIKSDHPGQKC